MLLLLALRALSLSRFVSTTLLMLILVTNPAAARQQTNAELEQQLDSYLVMLQKDVVTADQFLNELYLQHADEHSTVASNARLIAYQALALLYQQKQSEADALLATLLNLAALSANPDVLTEIYATEIEFLFQKRNYSAAVLKADRLELMLENATSPRIRYYANNVLGILFKTDSQYERALQHFTRALEAVIATDDQFTLRRRANLNYYIAQVHADLKNWPEAKTLTEQLIADAKKYDFKQLLPSYYLMLGFIEAEQGDLNSAIVTNILGIAAAKDVNSPGIELTFANNLGSTYIDQKRYSEAKATLTAAFERATLLNNELNSKIIAYNLGYIDVMEGNHDRGLNTMLSALEFFRENDSKAQFEPLLKALAEAYAAAGDYQMQAETLLQQLELRAEILTSEREKSIAELQERFNTKAKSQLITILEQENNLKAQLLDNQKLQQQLTALFALVLIFAAILLYQLYRKVRLSNRKLREANKKLEFQSLRDPLTGLFNRRALQEHMMRRAKFGRRQSDVSGSANAFLLLDIDFFKKINDNNGHAAGDEVLKQLSARLMTVCREEDLVIRWGGEEFLVYLDNIAAEQVAAFCKRILEVIASEPVVCEDNIIPVSASGGFIHLPFAGIDESELNWERALQIADMALYLSKVHGRNQVYAITGLRCDYDTARQPLTNDLQGAIQQNMVDYITIKGPALPQ